MQFKLRPLTGYTTVNEQHTTTVMVFWLSMYVMGFFVFNVVRSLSASLMTLIVSLYDAFLVSKTASQFWSQFGITIMNCSTIFKGNLMMCQRKMWESFKNKQQQQSFYFFAKCFRIKVANSMHGMLCADAGMYESGKDTEKEFLSWDVRSVLVKSIFNLVWLFVWVVEHSALSEAHCQSFVHFLF